MKLKDREARVGWGPHTTLLLGFQALVLLVVLRFGCPGVGVPLG